VMSLALPFADKKDLAVEQMEDGVAVHLNGRRCVLALPEEARNREATSWSFEPPVLKVVFGR
jgi:endonuclease YncB( thermonuclease family)